MKKTYLNIILFVFVIIIYGALFLKLFNRQKVPDNNINATPYLNTTSNYRIERDSFDISLLKVDPFRINKKRKTSPKITNTKSRHKSNVYAVKKVWPNITYFGFVKNDSKLTKLALLKVETRLYRKRETESINNITLVKVFNDSILLSLDGEIKIINRKKKNNS